MVKTTKHNFYRITKYLVANAALCCIAFTAIAAEPTKPLIEKKFPPTLPASVESVDGTLNTPEYVIIRPSDQVTFSSETTASIDSIPNKEGSSFKKGDVLLKFDCRLQIAEFKKAYAKQKEARVARIAAKKLQGYGSISQFEVVKAVSDEEIANADVDRLRAIVDKCIIKAPFNGSIADIMVNSHETVKPGDPLLKIVNTENLEFEIRVPSCWLQLLHLGDDFKVHINETKETISAKITKINPEVEPVSQTVKLIATITPPDPKLLPGMSGQAIFSEKTTSNCTEGKN